MFIVQTSPFMFMMLIMLEAIMSVRLTEKLVLAYLVSEHLFPQK